MTWFSLITGVVQILLLLLKGAERNKIVAETEAIERARVINKINKSLVAASQIPAELQGLGDKELDEYVQTKGWYRD